MAERAESVEREDGGDFDAKKRGVDRRSSERIVQISEPRQRRVKVRGDGSWADNGGLDDVGAALPETIDLSGHNMREPAPNPRKLNFYPKVWVINVFASSPILMQLS